ncbi:hypothetical protein EGW08_016764 [Elysia chlorotica]|uniref:Uncharacterized protein n=1 Tax=Elysia chlorotica TaxID=188477 RepID=A0A433T1P4_ELYCH|nr:hypothetical protein EGW08_016764 [Elysia chlorotica]
MEMRMSRGDEIPASHPDVGNRLGTTPGYPYPARTVQEYPILTKPSTPREVSYRVSPANHWASGYSPAHMDSLGSTSQTPPLYNMTKYSPSRETPPPSHQRPVIDSHLAPPLHKMARPSPSHETPHASPQPSAIHSHLFPPLQKRPRRPQETPPPSHQSPVNDHLAPPHHNVILPSHHPLSHLSSTPVPLYSDGVPEQDQPQDLSCKGRSTTATTTSPPSIDDDKNNMQDSPTNTNSHIPCARAPDPKTGGDVSSIYNEPEKQDLSVHPRLRPSP